MSIKKLTVFFALGLGMMLTACAKPIPLGPQSWSPVLDKQVITFDDLVAALQNKGANTVVTGDIAQPFFTITNGQILRVNGEDVQVFEFNDVSSRTAAAAKIPAEISRLDSVSAVSQQQAHFWSQGRLIVVYLGNDTNTVQLLNGLFKQPGKVS